MTLGSIRKKAMRGRAFLTRERRQAPSPWGHLWGPGFRGSAEAQQAAKIWGTHFGEGHSPVLCLPPPPAFHVVCLSWGANSSTAMPPWDIVPIPEWPNAEKPGAKREYWEYLVTDNDIRHSLGEACQQERTDSSSVHPRELYFLLFLCGRGSLPVFWNWPWGLDWDCKNHSLNSLHLLSRYFGWEGWSRVDSDFFLENQHPLKYLRKYLICYLIFPTTVIRYILLLFPFYQEGSCNAHKFSNLSPDNIAVNWPS